MINLSANNEALVILQKHMPYNAFVLIGVFFDQIQFLLHTLLTWKIINLLPSL